MSDPLADVLAQHGGLIHHLTFYEPLVDLDFLKSLDQLELFAEEACANGSEARERLSKPSAPPSLQQQRFLAAAFLQLSADAGSSSSSLIGMCKLHQPAIGCLA